MPKRRKGYVWKTPRFSHPELPGRTFYLELPIGKIALYEITPAGPRKVKRKRQSKGPSKMSTLPTPEKDNPKEGERDNRDRGRCSSTDDARSGEEEGE